MRARSALLALGVAVVAALGGATGCAAPATVEGVFGGEGFRLQSESPVSKPTGSGRDMVVLLSQIDGETLSTVSLTIPDFASQPVGEPIDVGTGAYGDDRPALEVAVGALLREVRADGVEILSSRDAVEAAAVGGTLTLDALAPEIAGSFRVDLDDGGYLEGSFVTLPAG